MEKAIRYIVRDPIRSAHLDWEHDRGLASQGYRILPSSRDWAATAKGVRQSEWRSGAKIVADGGSPAIAEHAVALRP